MIPLDPWIVVPFSRPEMRASVLANIERQRLRARVLIVENKAGIDALTDQPGFYVVRSTGGRAGVVKNDGLRYLRKYHPDAYVICMDDDDIYGPGYVEEHLARATPRMAWCKQSLWALFDSGLCYFPGLYAPGEVVPRTPIGGTLSFFLRDVGWYCTDSNPADERGIIESLRANGGELYNMGPSGVCINRQSPETHTWKAPEANFRAYLGPGINVDARPLDVINSVVYGPGI